MTENEAIEIGKKIYVRHTMPDVTKIGDTPITKVSEDDFIKFVERSLCALIEVQKYRALEGFKIGYLKAVDDFYNKCGQKVFKNDRDLSMTDITLISRQLKKEVR